MSGSSATAAAPVASNYLRDAWLIILLALLYGGGLAITQLTLTPKIEANKLAEALSAVPVLVPGSLREHTEQAVLAGMPAFIAYDAQGTKLGVVIKASGSGFADRIELLIGLDARGDTITGLRVIDQKETPGLGDFISSKDFAQRFPGKSTAQPLKAVRGAAQAPGEFKALTGATVSSASVADIVNKAVAQVKPLLQEAKP